MSHLRKMLMYHFPDHYGDGLRLMLKGESPPNVETFYCGSVLLHIKSL